jgi:hypothetical protein
MHNFLILFIQKGNYVGSGEELQKRINAYQQWMEKIPEHRITESRLENQGKRIRKRKELITEGPFSEANEIIAGYLMIKAEGLDEATRICKDSPFLEYFDMEVRPII